MLKRLFLIPGLTNGLPRVAGAFSIFFFALAGAFLPSAVRADVSFSASFDRDTIAANETINLTLTFEGGAPSRLPEMPSVPNVLIEGPNSQGQSTIIANGQTVNSYTFTYTVRAAKEGTYVIPALRTTDASGKTLQSVPITLKVVPASKMPKTTGGAFLKLIVPKTNVFLGEILPLEIQLYVLGARNGDGPHLKEEGFTLGKMNQSQNATILNNQRYTIVSFKTFVIPVKAGKIDLGPVTMGLQVPVPSGQVDFLRRPLMEWQNVTLESDPQTLNVQPLPHENVPASFSGAVGNWTMTVEASPTNVAVGDPITVKVQIEGRGALDGITLPAQVGWEQFKLYPPVSETQTADSLGITGNKTFKLTAVPQSLDIKELPAYAFSFFDPDQKAYRTLTQPAIPLTLRPSAASLPPTALNAPTAPADNAESSQNILSIKQHLGNLAQIQPPIAVRGWFILVQFIPVAVWLSLLIRRKSAERLAANPHLRRQRLVAQIVREGLKKLNHAAQQNDPETFFATAFHLLQEQLGERLDRPASAITEAVLDEPALVNRLPEETLAALHDLFHTFNQARYAPQSTNAELVSLAVTVQDALNILKQLHA